MIEAAAQSPYWLEGLWAGAEVAGATFCVARDLLEELR